MLEPSPVVALLMTGVIVLVAGFLGAVTLTYLKSGKGDRRRA